LGDFALFSFSSLSTIIKKPTVGTMIPICFRVGVQSVPVVSITGMFIGMVMAIQVYSQFQSLGLATQLGQIINVSVIKELGPVLAATMLAGRIGSSMSAELATMKVTEQVDALICLGINPLHYLVLPRVLACVLLIPILTILANFMGVFGGSMVCTEIFKVDPYHYWQNSRGHIQIWDLAIGLIKPIFFGAAIALISCHRGMNSRAGAEGVGKAATSAFVWSFSTARTGTLLMKSALMSKGCDSDFYSREPLSLTASMSLIMSLSASGPTPDAGRMKLKSLCSSASTRWDSRKVSLVKNLLNYQEA